MPHDTNSPLSSIVDRFLIVVIILVTLISAVDWLIGQSGRERLQKMVGDWWVIVETTTFGENISAYASFIFETYKELFESDEYGGKFHGFFNKLVFILIPDFISYVIFAARWFWTYGLGGRLAPGQTGRNNHMMIIPMLLSLLVGLVGLHLARWIALSLLKGSNALLIAKLILMSTAYVVFAVFSVIVSIAVANLFEFHVRPLYTRSIFPSQTAYDFKWEIFGREINMHVDKFINDGVLAFSVASLSLIFLIVFGMQFFFIFAKIFHFALKPVTSLLLQRFYESKQGILTVIAVTLGALAKLIQELTKLT
jgi:hypothetical protein